LAAAASRRLGSDLQRSWHSEGVFIINEVQALGHPSACRPSAGTQTKFGCARKSPEARAGGENPTPSAKKKGSRKAPFWNSVCMPLLNPNRVASLKADAIVEFAGYSDLYFVTHIQNRLHL